MRTSGIWQPVWLEPVQATRIAELRWTPDLDNALLRLDVRFTRAEETPLRLHILLTFGGDVLADDLVLVRGDRLVRDLPLSRTDLPLGDARLLWSPEAPNLIDARLRLLQGNSDSPRGEGEWFGGQVVD
jgi:hypothetical protein